MLLYIAYLGVRGYSENMNDPFAAISKKGQSYSDVNTTRFRDGYISIYKCVGYTPLQVLEEVRQATHHMGSMTYVGRLDPMAEGWFILLFNGDMRLKDKLMAKDKTYEVGVLLGITTDTGDILGKIKSIAPIEILEENFQKSLEKYVGKFTWEYPGYSSPMLGKDAAAPIKQKDIEIYSIELLNYENIKATVLLESVYTKLGLSRMPGDFRLTGLDEEFPLFTIRVHCSSGTYMRTLAEKLGGLAFAIKRM
jgi:tRNA pseudouridine55 synthase